MHKIEMSSVDETTCVSVQGQIRQVAVVSGSPTPAPTRGNCTWSL